ncbi:hypothetical protein WJX84_010845 [Apatococcus fuscideae]|uniref:GRAM domain-containing protein n=1 Tax=Apatococcus fuscideae TaxID=2026836 RepID=A0AAW1SZG7_9CHLO
MRLEASRIPSKLDQLVQDPVTSSTAGWGFSRMTEPAKRISRPLSASSSVSDLSFEDVRLEEANRVASNRTGTERSESVGLPTSQVSAARAEPASPFAAAAATATPVDSRQTSHELSPAPSVPDEISWRGAPPPPGPSIQVDSAALRENLANFAGQAANTAGQAANTLSDATLAASSKVLLSSARGREILMEKLSKQIPPQAGSWLTEGITNLSSGLTDTVHTGLSAVQHFWANADASIKAAKDEAPRHEAQGSDQVRALFELLEEEELMEAFPCNLLQNYTCAHNSFTEAQQVPFVGHLYMTGSHICFHSEPRAHFKVLLKSLKNIEKSTESGREVVRMELGAGQQLIFGGFKAFDMDNFLALAWHFTSDTT